VANDLPERRSGSKIFAGTAFHRVPAPLHPCANSTYDSRAGRAAGRVTGAAAPAADIGITPDLDHTLDHTHDNVIVIITIVIIASLM